MKGEILAESGMVRRRILVLAPLPPRSDSHQGGSQLIARQLNNIAAAHSVRLLYFRTPGEPDMEPALASLCESVEAISRPAPLQHSRWCRLMLALCRGTPMWVSEWGEERFRRRIRETIAEWRPEIIHVEFHIMGQYFDAFEGIPSLLIHHEPGAPAAEERYRDSPGWQSWIRRRDHDAWRRYEQTLMPRFDAVICFSHADLRAIQAIAPQTNLLVVPPCGPSSLSPPAEPHDEPQILFIGNFGHPPNVDAAVRMGRVILPLVHRQRPDARLVLVGDAPPAVVRALRSDRVEVTGRVPSVAPYLSAASIVALPLRRGGGARIKTMEALSAGKAVIATQLAVEGLSVVPRHDYLAAETDEEFAAMITDLLADGELRRRLAGSARAWGEGYCRSRRILEAFNSVYAQLTERP